MRVTTECKCCGKKICYPPALVCTMCAMLDPEAKSWLELEQATSDAKAAASDRHIGPDGDTG